ncbi:MAG: hypothetical protein MUF12_01870 [Sediminibacterium sp.]|jgi:hypothetical protein|nr:hypothetical protein [Sediminibacterium sp.]
MTSTPSISTNFSDPVPQIMDIMIHQLENEEGEVSVKSFHFEEVLFDWEFFTSELEYE